MSLPRFHIATLMIAGGLFALIPAARTASSLNWMILIGCAMIFALGITVFGALTVVFEFLFPPSSTPPRK